MCGWLSNTTNCLEWMNVWFVMMHEFDLSSKLEVQGTAYFLFVECLSCQDCHHGINTIDYYERAVFFFKNHLYEQFENGCTDLIDNFTNGGI